MSNPFVNENYQPLFEVPMVKNVTGVSGPVRMSAYIRAVSPVNAMNEARRQHYGYAPTGRVNKIDNGG